MASDVNIAPNLLGEAFVKFLGNANAADDFCSACTGKRLYELARKAFRARPRLIRIHQLHIRYGGGC